MAFEERQGFCKSCDKKVLARRQSPTHILHFFLSIITFGTWILIWIFVSLNTQTKPFLCTQCGGRVKGNVTSFFKEWKENKKTDDGRKRNKRKGCLIAVLIFMASLLYLLYKFMLFALYY